jgi:pantetheine-phosphate adenylyltransferase
LSKGSPKPFRVAAVGGTFDVLHRGHKILLRRAFLLADKVLIGLSKNSFVSQLHKPHKVDSYARREYELKRYLKRQGLLSRAKIVPLEDRYGPTLSDPKIELLVVSDETKSVAKKINLIRRRKGLKPLKVISMRMVLAEDYKPISSTRIRRNEIDREGYLMPRPSPK